MQQVEAERHKQVLPTQSRTPKPACLSVLIPLPASLIPSQVPLDTHGSTSEMGEPLRRTWPRPGVTWATAVAVCCCEVDNRQSQKVACDRCSVIPANVPDGSATNKSRETGEHSRVDDQKEDAASATCPSFAGSAPKQRTFFLPKVWTADIFLYLERTSREIEGWSNADREDSQAMKIQSPIQVHNWFQQKLHDPNFAVQVSRAGQRSNRFGREQQDDTERNGRSGVDVEGAMVSTGVVRFSSSLLTILRWRDDQQLPVRHVQPTPASCEFWRVGDTVQKRAGRVALATCHIADTRGTPAAHSTLPLFVHACVPHMHRVSSVSCSCCAVLPNLCTSALCCYAWTAWTALMVLPSCEHMKLTQDLKRALHRCQPIVLSSSLSRCC